MIVCASYWAILTSDSNLADGLHARLKESLFVRKDCPAKTLQTNSVSAGKDDMAWYRLAYRPAILKDLADA